MKKLVEIEVERLDDLLEDPAKLAEGLVNIMDPNPSCADTWEIGGERWPLGGKYKIVLRRHSRESREEDQYG